MQIFVQTPVGNAVAVDVDGISTVENLKMNLNNITGVAPAEQVLTFSGLVLQDENSLEACSILDESTLSMSLRLCGGGDGTPAMGKRHKHTHGLCPRCGKRSFHHQKKTCASCGYPAAKIRSYEWAMKAKRRRAPGTGRMKYLKTIPRRFKNGFREGTTAPARRKAKN